MLNIFVKRLNKIDKDQSASELAKHPKMKKGAQAPHFNAI
jgi:hypothetical protein